MDNLVPRALRVARRMTGLSSGASHAEGPGDEVASWIFGVFLTMLFFEESEGFLFEDSFLGPSGWQEESCLPGDVHMPLRYAR